MAKTYYCCIHCDTIFGCYDIVAKKEVRCSQCRHPCKYDGTHKKHMSQFILSHGICQCCYLKVKEDLDKQRKAITEKKQEAENAKRISGWNFHL